jgi:hypothetical protein
MDPQAITICGGFSGGCSSGELAGEFEVKLLAGNKASIVYSDFGSPGVWPAAGLVGPVEFEGDVRMDGSIEFGYVDPSGLGGAYWRIDSPESSTPVLNGIYIESRVDGFFFEFADVSLRRPDQPERRRLHLDRRQLSVTVDWSSSLHSGPGRASSLNDRAGYFWFFDPANPEVFAKALPICLSGHWLFLGGLTNLGVSIDVVDNIQPWRSKTYLNSLGTDFSSSGDTSSFSGCL